ncbi:MAG: dienelactone hydrolase family protein [Pyrinomonadaceae bacterium]|nr:dienelactone hydrolase family protein [Pyrinomonadaceae bacterium]
MRSKLSSLLSAFALCGLLISLFAFAASAQQRPDPTKQPVVLTMPGTEKVTVQRDMTFKTVEGAALKMDVYYPPDIKAGARLPVVIFVNGVGIPNLKDWQVYVDWGKLTAAAGMIAINHQSRSALSAVTDAADLVAYVRSNAATLKIDENRIGIWACSANVNVGLPLAMDESRKYIRTAVMYYGVMDPEQVSYDVPMLVARAGQDIPIINNTIDAYITRAIAQDAPLTLISYADGQHAFDILDNTDQSREIVKQTLDFLKFHLLKNEAADTVIKRAPSPGRFVAMINNAGIMKALQAFEEGKKANPQAVLFRENVLNGIGYQLLQDSRIREAIEIFKLNVAAYPESANVYDSLGDAYEANGNKEMAIQNAEKTLELLAKDTNLPEAAKTPIRDSASNKLKRLKEQK